MSSIKIFIQPHHILIFPKKGNHEPSHPLEMKKDIREIFTIVSSHFYSETKFRAIRESFKLKCSPKRLNCLKLRTG